MAPVDALIGLAVVGIHALAFVVWPLGYVGFQTALCAGGYAAQLFQSRTLPDGVGAAHGSADGHTTGVGGR